MDAILNTLTVEGAGCSELDGVYSRSSEQQQFVQANGSGSKIWFHSPDKRWFLGNPGKHSGKATYHALGSAGSPPMTGWLPSSEDFAFEPAPTFRLGRESDQTLEVEGGGVCELNGVYRRTGEKQWQHSSGSQATVWYLPHRHIWCMGQPGKHKGKATYWARGAICAPPVTGWVAAGDGCSMKPFPTVWASRHFAPPELTNGGTDDARKQEAIEGRDGAGDCQSVTAQPRRILIMCMGTRGDVQPFCALGKILARRGHRVCLAANSNHQRFVESCGLSFLCLAASLESSHGLLLIARFLSNLVVYFACSAFTPACLVGPSLSCVWPQWLQSGWLHVLFYLIVGCISGRATPILCRAVSKLTGAPCARIPPAFSEQVNAASVLMWALVRHLFGLFTWQWLALYAASATWLVSLFVLTFRDDYFGGLTDIAATLQGFADWTCPVECLLAHVETERPDVIVCQSNCTDLGVVLSRTSGIPLRVVSLTASLLPAHEALYKGAVVRERLAFAYPLGCRPMKKMGYEAWAKLCTEDLVMALPTALVDDTELKGCMLDSKLCYWMLEKGTVFTGVWKLDEDEHDAFPEMFGGSKSKASVEEFLAKGERPVFIGWGSMLSPAGPASMCYLAVAALRKAGRRGIVLGGWAKLNVGMLKGPSMQSLREYAERNVLFLEKAPHAWLFPRCCCAVIHGGIGTLMSCWQSGVPSIVCPVAVDQPFNAVVNATAGCGVAAPDVDRCTPDVLGRLISDVVSSSFIKSKAARIRSLMVKEDGALNAAMLIEEFIDKVRSKRD